MKEYRFSGEVPILIFDFPAPILEEYDIIGLTEEQDYVVSPQLTSGKAARHSGTKETERAPKVSAAGLKRSIHY